MKYNNQHGNNNNTVTFSGVISNIIYSSSGNPWCVLNVKTKDDLGWDRDDNDVIVTGDILSPQSGDNVKVTGTLSNHNTYGKQIKAKFISIEQSRGKNDAFKILTSPCISGVGPKLARRIVDKFEDKTFDIIENTPNELLKVNGIKNDKLAKIIDGWKKSSGVRNLIYLIGDYINHASISKIYSKWGDASISFISKNPYVMLEVERMDFESVDAFAISTGMSEGSNERIGAIVWHIVKKYCHASGSTSMMYVDVCKKVKSIIQTKDADILGAINGNKKILVLDKSLSSSGNVYIKNIFNSEMQLSHKMIRQNMQPSNISISNIVTDGLSKTQHEAIVKALNSKISVLTGGPGTGKSFCIGKIVDILKQNQLTFALLAPTGRAAKRIQELTGEDAYTIHRFFSINPMDEDVFGDDSNEDTSGAKNSDVDFIIIDETSMVDIILANKIFSYINSNTNILLVGDSNQLQSVGVGNFLKDTIASGIFPVCELKEIFRQSMDSDIVVNAHRINNGMMPVIRNSNGMYFFSPTGGKEAADIITNHIYDYVKKEFNIDSEDVQVLIPMYNGECGVTNVNKLIQDKLLFNKSKKCVKYGQYSYHVGDRVMHIKNNYTKGLYNGDLGYIKKVTSYIDDDGVAYNQIVVEYDGVDYEYINDDLGEIILAYSMTVHKSQGCEYKCVVCVLMSDHYPMQNRNLLYTAITRAKNICILVGEKLAIQRAVGNTQTERFTSLRHFLKSLHSISTEV